MSPKVRWIRASPWPNSTILFTPQLDYYYDHSPREVQQRVFRRQLELALQIQMPVIIHTRDAEEDTIQILREAWFECGGSEIGGIIHCFTGTQKLADEALAMGFLISFSGVVTFKTADALREVAASIPLDKLLVETDCPYLAPVPYRGKRNEPAFVKETAILLAALRNVSFAEMAQRTNANFKRLFKL
jgi:TatD DNase family protein